ncbi:ABC transporter ATP-binding protein, partial [Salmonella sp. hn-f5]|nr:ABC transporter ATP-binding protein [Salmonella sp. hn-f5]
ALSSELLTQLSAIGRLVHTVGPTVYLEIPAEETLPKIAEAVVRSGARLYALKPERMSLEDLFVQLVEGGVG